MDALKFNKIAGAGLAAVLLITVSNILGNAIFKPHNPEQTAMAVAVEEEEKGGAAAVADTRPLPVLLAEGNPKDGEKAFKKCVSCHTGEKGGANRVGPNLFDIVNRKAASASGFSYSSALSGSGKTWTFADLDAFVANPKGIVAGTKMTFAGIKNPADRASLLLYLRGLSDAPKELPK